MGSECHLPRRKTRGRPRLGCVKTQPNVLAIVLAGGEGKRLFLSPKTAPSAVPFGGSYRLIDFVLSNLVNAGYLKIAVLTQYKSHSLDRHISQAWSLHGPVSQYIASVPAQQRRGKRWFTGSADAIVQSINLVYDEKPDYVIVFGADHVYRMDPSQMVEEHIASGKGCSVAGIRVPRMEATAFGCIQSDDEGNITEFLEKPADPPSTPDDPDVTYASMGNYVFTTDALIKAARRRRTGLRPRHGRRHHPYFVERGDARLRLHGQRVRVPGATRATGVTSVPSTRSTGHMDLISVTGVQPVQPHVAIHSTEDENFPPAKFTGAHRPVLHGRPGFDRLRRYRPQLGPGR